jgi:hypothetical protein
MEKAMTSTLNANNNAEQSVDLVIVTEIYEAPQNSLLQVVVQVVAFAQK